MPARKKLTGKQQRFVDEYLTNGRKASDAYRASYSAAGSAQTVARRAQELLKNGLIKAIVDEADRNQARRIAAMGERIAVSKEWISHELAKLAAGQGVYPNEWIPSGVRSTSLERLARLHGYVIERKDMRVVRQIADLSDEELAAIVAEGDRHDGVRH